MPGVLHAKPDLRVFLKWMIAGSGSVITDVMSLNMNNSIATLLCILHMLVFAACTYVAAINIESVLFTGWVCSATGLAAGVASMAAGNRAISLVSFLTPAVAVTLTYLEMYVLQLGPVSAALPFCVLFIVLQLITNVVSFQHIGLKKDGQSAGKQISIKSMLIVTLASALFFAVCRQLLRREHNVLMWIALTLAGLTFVGVVMAMYNWACLIRQRGAT